MILDPSTAGNAHIILAQEAGYPVRSPSSSAVNPQSGMLLEKISFLAWGSCLTREQSGANRTAVYYATQV